MSNIENELGEQGEKSDSQLFSEYERIVSIEDTWREDAELISDNQEIGEQYNKYRQERLEVEKELEKRGWVFIVSNSPYGDNNAIKIELRHSKKSEPIIQIDDIYGKVKYVKKGQTFQAKKSQARMIPREVRESIINALVWKGDVATELYARIPESKEPKTKKDE